MCLMNPLPGKSHRSPFDAAGESCQSDAELKTPRRESVVQHAAATGQYFSTFISKRFPHLFRSTAEYLIWIRKCPAEL